MNESGQAEVLEPKQSRARERLRRTHARLADDFRPVRIDEHQLQVRDRALTQIPAWAVWCFHSFVLRLLVSSASASTNHGLPCAT